MTRPRIAFVPLAGGKAVPSTATQQLPAEVYLGGATGDSLSKVAFTGTSTSGDTTVSGSGVSWSQSRGAVYINGTVYVGWSDGNLYARTLRRHDLRSRGLGERHGHPGAPDRLPQPTSRPSRRCSSTPGRLYYTLSGQSTLYYRYFTPSTNVIGAVRYTAVNNTRSTSATPPRCSPPAARCTSETAPPGTCRPSPSPAASCPAPRPRSAAQGRRRQLERRVGLRRPASHEQAAGGVVHDQLHGD